MRFKRIKYLIDDSYGRGGKTKTVNGYAIDYPCVRLCVHKSKLGDWRIDHYDTGLGVNIPDEFFINTKERAAELAINYIEEKIKTGEYDKAVARAYCSNVGEEE